MPKKKFLKIGLMAFLFAFGLFISGVLAENEAEIDCQGVGPTLSGNHSYPGNWVCTADPGMEYDNDNSADVVYRENSEAIYVIGNNAPFTWTISGEGFWFDPDYTTTTIVTLNNFVVVYADDTACGPGKITVTGCDGVSKVGDIRCGTGVWVRDFGPTLFLAPPEWANCNFEAFSCMVNSPGCDTCDTSGGGLWGSYTDWWYEPDPCHQVKKLHPSSGVHGTSGCAVLLGNTFFWSDGVSHPFSVAVSGITEETPNGCLRLNYELWIYTCP